MAWLLELADGDRDLYPEVKRRAFEKNDRCLASGETHGDMVRYELLRHFGYYVTESSEHNAEYTPWWIKERLPELVGRYGIPLDEYPRRCVRQIERWKRELGELVGDPAPTHVRTSEYGSWIMEAMETDVPCRIGGNVMNTGLIPNLPSKAVVELPCLVDRNGVQGCAMGELPEQCAALNRSNINVQLLTIEAVLTLRKDAIYQAAFLDPHTAAELPLDRIKALVDELLEAHGEWLPAYR
jgi:alpha-galactosidase